MDMAESATDQAELDTELTDPEGEEEEPQLDPEVVARRAAALAHVKKFGEPVLRTRSRPVERFDDALRDEVRRMSQLMIDSIGVGLAANQVGVCLRLFVWDMADDWGVRHVGHIANPVLDELPAAGRRLAEEPEGCLSVPGPYRTLPRPDRAVVRGQDKDGNALVIEGRGYFARCLQHETDHLSGHLYLDRLSLRERRSALREMAAAQGDVLARRAARAARLGK